MRDKILGIDPSEKVLHEVRRHPIGLWGIYFTTAIVVVIFIVVTYIFRDFQSESIAFNFGNFIIPAGAILIILAIGTSFVAEYIYKSNLLIITNENIIQILRFSLFNTQTSQLNLAKIQDVSVDQQGIIQTFFNYGTIEIETAGEASNFRFPFTPHPNIVAKYIIEAHEDFVKTNKGGDTSI